MSLYLLENVSYAFPEQERNVLERINLSLEKGEVLSILGANGAGKSTLLNCMAGMLTPREGRIFLDETNIAQYTPRQIALLVAYVPQMHVPAFGYTVLHFVLMGRAPYIGTFQKPGKMDTEIAMNALDALGIAHLAEKSYMEISGGERQQATIARAIAQNPQVILFDEPTAHLDYGNQYRILRLIRTMSEKGYGIVITTHNPDHALLLGGNSAILSREGTLSAGPCAAMITEERLKEIYHIDLRLQYIEDLNRTACLSPQLDTGKQHT